MNIPLNGYLLITPGVQPTDVRMDCFPTLQAAMDHKGDSEWAVVAVLNETQENFNLITVAYFNRCSYGTGLYGEMLYAAARQGWTRITRS